MTNKTFGYGPGILRYYTLWLCLMSIMPALDLFTVNRDEPERSENEPLVL